MGEVDFCNDALVTSAPSADIFLRKEDDIGPPSLLKLLLATGDQRVEGAVARPYDFARMALMKNRNPHHGTAIRAKVQCTVGLGLEDEAAEDKLDDLCYGSLWSVLIQSVCYDVEDVGTGAIEVVRGNDGIRLFWRPARDFDIILEPDLVNVHYVVQTSEGPVVLARYGDVEDLRRRLAADPNPKPYAGQEQINELILFRAGTNMHREWGHVEWLSAVPYMEVAQAAVQHMFDFHQNRGVPDLLVLVSGGKVDATAWKQFKADLDRTVGLGNQHRSMAANIPLKEAKVDVHMLALDNQAISGTFAQITETATGSIMSAHGVPLALAAVAVPGKMGAANESSNAIMMFQALIVGPRQALFERTLNRTIGKELGIKFKFKTLIDEMGEQLAKLRPADTIGRMKDSLPQAAAEGRDLGDGLQD